VFLKYEVRGRVTPLLVLLVLAWTASLTSGANANFEDSRRWFETLTNEQRVSLQTDLTLVGLYNSFVDGVFGPSTYGAITAFQRMEGQRQSGVLTDALQQSLLRSAASVFDELGLEVVQDERAELELAVPTRLTPDRVPTSVGSAYTRSDGEVRLETVRQSFEDQPFQSYFSQLARSRGTRKVTYTSYADSYFVISGLLGDDYFYTLMLSDENQTVGYNLTWSEGYKREGSIVAVLLASSVTPLSGNGAAEVAQDPEAIENEPSSSPALPPTNDNAITEIGSFLVFNELPGVLGLRGEIGFSAPLDFRRAVRAAGTPKLLLLASEGGLVSSALLLAYQVHELGISTYVLPETGCYSACSFIFLAGSERLVEGALGVHQVWGDQSDASVAQTVVSDILDAFHTFEVRQEVTSAMLRTLPEDMYVFNERELAQWNINAGDPARYFALQQKDASSDRKNEMPSTAGEVQRSDVSVTSKPTNTVSIPVRSGASLTIVLRQNSLPKAFVDAVERVFEEAELPLLLPAGTELEVSFGKANSSSAVIPRKLVANLPTAIGFDSIQVELGENGN
jgi:hypothetical protein